MKLIALTLSAVAALLLSTSAIAGKDKHDVTPMYGGVVTEVKDINYELVAKTDSITLYVTDHGKAVDTKNSTATMTLLSASDKTDIALMPSGENKLEAKGAFKIAPGTKAVVKIALDGKPAQSVKFKLK